MAKVQVTIESESPIKVMVSERKTDDGIQKLIKDIKDSREDDGEN